MKNGWIKFYILKPDIQATYYAVSLAKLNGDISNYPLHKIENYLLNTVESLERSVSSEKNPSEKDVVDAFEIAENLRTLYLSLKIYKLLGKNFPTTKIIRTANILINRLATAKASNGTISITLEAYSYYILISNALEHWPTRNSKLTEDILIRMNSYSKFAEGLIESRKPYDIRFLHSLYVVNSAVRSSQTSQILINALFQLFTGNGFKRTSEINLPDMESTYLGIWIASQTKNLEPIKSNLEKISEFLLESREEYGYNYAPNEQSLYADYRSTYCALWVLSGLECLKENSN